MEWVQDVNSDSSATQNGWFPDEDFDIVKAHCDSMKSDDGGLREDIKNLFKLDRKGRWSLIPYWDLQVKGITPVDYYKLFRDICNKKEKENTQAQVGTPVIVPAQPPQAPIQQPQQPQASPSGQPLQLTPGSVILTTKKTAKSCQDPNKFSEAVKSYYQCAKKLQQSGDCTKSTTQINPQDLDVDSSQLAKKVQTIYDSAMKLVGENKNQVLVIAGKKKSRRSRQQSRKSNKTRQSRRRR